MTASYGLMFCRIAIAVIFGWSALGKLRDLRGFRDAITAFRLLPRDWSTPLAWAFVGGEIAVVLLMLRGVPTLLGLGFALAAGLLALFTAVLVSAMRRALAVSCNCFGSSEQPISWYDVVRNALLIVCSLLGGWLLTLPRRGLTIDETLLLGAMALCFVLLVTHVEDVAETLRRPFELQ
ncbi:MAG TPA: MauE/DoxX family redox-associated membrane protein, partial [Herpetosiphonaceae bacterium]